MKAVPQPGPELSKLRAWAVSRVQVDTQLSLFRHLPVAAWGFGRPRLGWWAWSDNPRSISGGFQLQSWLEQVTETRNSKHDGAAISECVKICKLRAFVIAFRRHANGELLAPTGRTYVEIRGCCIWSSHVWSPMCRGSGAMAGLQRRPGWLPGDRSDMVMYKIGCWLMCPRCTWELTRWGYSPPTWEHERWLVFYLYRFKKKNHPSRILGPVWFCFDLSTHTIWREGGGDEGNNI